MTQLWTDMRHRLPSYSLSKIQRTTPILKIRTLMIVFPVFALVAALSGCSGGGTSGYTTPSVDCANYTPALSISTIAPAIGTSSGGTSIVITGSGFATCETTATVKIGGIVATNIVVESNNTITCTTPAGSGTATVLVTVNNASGGDYVGNSGTSSSTFTYN
jgi:hypothetical protein